MSDLTSKRKTYDVIWLDFPQSALTQLSGQNKNSCCLYIISSFLLTQSSILHQHQQTRKKEQYWLYVSATQKQLCVTRQPNEMDDLPLLFCLKNSWLFYGNVQPLSE